MGVDFRMKLSVPAGTTLPTVVRAELDESAYDKLASWVGEAELVAADSATGAQFACQLNREALSASPDGAHGERALYMRIDEAELPLETELTFGLRSRPQHKPQDRKYNPWSELAGVYMDHQPERARVVVSIEGKLFTRYMYSEQVAKPYFYPLIGPHGKTLIMDGPDDHLHHHGLWWGHDDVNGHRLYHEFRGEGRQIHRRFLTLSGGPVFGQLTALIDWEDENGRLLLQETRSMRIYNLPPESRYIDLATGLHAVAGDVAFGATKEGGFPFVRVNEQINGHHTGVITAANGGTGEADIFGAVTEWVDYSGKLLIKARRDGSAVVRETVDAGIAVFAHPDNDTFATQWFVRDYGPFTPANFHFAGGHRLAGGEAIAMKHRIYIHEGDMRRGAVGARYEEYARPDAIVRLEG